MSKFIIEVRTKGFSTAEAALKRTSAQTRQFARDANKASTAGAGFRREVSSIRNNMLLYAFAIGGTITALGKFVMASSNAKEQADQFNIVFGDFAPKADAFAASIQSSFGIAKSEMIGLLAGLQDTFVPLGFSREKASELAMSIAQLSLDVGAFKNMATGDVAKRMTSALIGNHDAVRELGISLTEVTIKQEAMRLGIISSNEEMTQEAKILGRISLLSKGTTDAIDNMSITQKEFASRLRGTTGRLTSLAEAIGDGIKPLATFTLGLVDVFANLRSFKILLGGATIALTAYYGGAALSAINTMWLNRALSRNVFIAGGTAFALAIQLAAEKFGIFGAAAKEAAPPIKSLDALVKDFADSNLDLSDGLVKNTQAFEAQAEAAKTLQEAQEKGLVLLTLRLALMNEETEHGKYATTVRINENRSITMMESILVKQIDAMKNKLQADKDQLSADALAIQALKDRKEAEEDILKMRETMIDQTSANDKQRSMIQEKLNGATDITIKKMSLQEQGLQQIAAAMPKTQGAYTLMTSRLVDANEQLDANALGLGHITGQQRELIDSIIHLTNVKILDAEASGVAADATKKMADETKAANKVKQDFNKTQQQAAGYIIATAVALKGLTDKSMTFEQQFSSLLQGLGSIMMMIPGMQIPGAIAMAGSMFVGHTGGLIKDNGIQRFATGGMVQGEDNIPIMAQAGEFIMQRSAVQQIGVQSLAEMNNGGASSGVTVNIQGNMVGNKEFVRDIMLPEIKASLNRA